MLNLKCLFTCVAFLAFTTTCQCADAMAGDEQRFLENILHFYGENASISTQHLEDLLLLISDRRSQSITEDNPLVNQEVSIRNHSD